MTQNQCVLNVTSFDLNKAITFSKFFNQVKLSASARLVLRCLIDFWNPNKGLVYPGQKMLSECTGASLRSIVDAVEELRVQGLLLTEGQAGQKLKYYFTPKFFELAKIAQPSAKTAQAGYAKTAQHEQKNHEQSNNNKVISFNSKMPYRHNTQQEGVNYPSPEASKKAIEKVLTRDEKNPKNDKETAWIFIKSLENQLNNPIIKKKVDEICEIHGICLDLPAQPMQNLHTPDVINYKRQF